MRRGIAHWGDDQGATGDWVNAGVSIGAGDGDAVPVASTVGVRVTQTGATTGAGDGAGGGGAAVGAALGDEASVGEAVGEAGGGAAGDVTAGVGVAGAHETRVFAGCTAPGPPPPPNATTPGAGRADLLGDGLSVGGAAVAWGVAGGGGAGRLAGRRTLRWRRCGRLGCGRRVSGGSVDPRGVDHRQLPQRRDDDDGSGRRTDGCDDGVPPTPDLLAAVQHPVDGWGLRRAGVVEAAEQLVRAGHRGINSRSRDSPRLPWVFTDPTDTPSRTVVCSSVWSPRKRSTTTSRCRRGSSVSAR